MQIPKYDFCTHSRIRAAPPQGHESGGSEAGKGTADDVIKGSTSGGEKIMPSDVIIVEGILIYAVGPELRDEMDMKIFVDCDSDVRLARRLQRDIEERGRDFQVIFDFSAFLLGKDECVIAFWSCS